MPRPTKDLTGQIFNDLYVIKKNGLKKRTHWLCKCVCGNETTVEHTKIQTGHTKSCGCLKVKATRIANTTHGHSLNYKVTPTYKSWSGCIQRCTRECTWAYKYYGARGIKVDPRWSTFQQFLADMGECPPGYTLDRIDVNGDYCKENCRWATREEQTNNRRNTKRVEYNGTIYPLAVLAKKVGIKRHILYGRITLGWSVEKAVTTPAPAPSRNAQR